MQDFHTLCLVSCTSRKSPFPVVAEELYKSPLFEGARHFAETRTNSWFILSAKHGLLQPKQIVEPYDESLHALTDQQLSSWSSRTYQQLAPYLKPSTRVIFLAGEKYRLYLQKLLAKDGHEVRAPMSSLGIGQQVSWLQKVAEESKRLADIDRFYVLLQRIAKIDLNGIRSLGERTAQSVPKKGIYFFLQPEEIRMTSPFENRVVRIGTHSVSTGSKSTLWNRLRTHRGGADGNGNHRGSIFRLHVGDALIRKHGFEKVFATWGIGQSAPEEIRSKETEIELEVSKIISEMQVLWLSVGDEASPDSDRTYLERNLIALLAGSKGPLDLPSRKWLGHWCSREAISYSGLWNVNHVYEAYDPHALEVLAQYVTSAEGNAEPIVGSLAPKGWRAQLQNSKVFRQQLKLV